MENQTYPSLHNSLIHRRMNLIPSSEIKPGTKPHCETVSGRLLHCPCPPIAKYIKGNLHSLPRKNDNNMIKYTFTDENGRRISEYRPFSISYAVRQTPGLSHYGCQHYGRPEEAAGPETARSESTETPAPTDLLATFTSQNLKFDSLSLDIIRQMVAERVQIRDKNRKDIMGRISDLSGQEYPRYSLDTADSQKQKAALDKTKFDLEKQARDEDVSLWKDLTDLRKELLLNQRKYESTRTRNSLIGDLPNYD